MSGPSIVSSSNLSPTTNPLPSGTAGSGASSLPKNRPPSSAYLKSHKSITFSYGTGSSSFQHGSLGDSDTYLIGTIHLNYGQPRQVKSVHLNLRGAEKTSWYKAQARSKALYTGEQILVDQTYKVWEAEDEKPLQTLDIPFKIKLAYNLPESVTTEIGSVNYVLRATIQRKGSLTAAATQIVEVTCPLKRTIILDHQNNPPYKLRGESRSGLDYTFVLPPNKSLNLGTYVSIPMRIRFLKREISVERVEIMLKTCMDFRCGNPNETRHVKEQAASLVIPRQEIRYLQPSSPHYDGECVHTINLFIPRSVQPTYSGRFISITHQLCIKFCLWGADMDFQVEESVRVANIFEKASNDTPVALPAVAAPPLASGLPPHPMHSMAALAHHQHHSRSTTPFPYLEPARSGTPYPYTEPFVGPGVNDESVREIKSARYLNAYNTNAEPNERNRRPSQSSTADLPPPFPYDGYGKVLYDYNYAYSGYDFWCRHKLDVALQHLRPATPKSPPMHPPPPVPAINTFMASGMAPSESPSTKTTPPPTYASPISPPPYRQPPPRQYIDATYAFDFDD